MRSVHTIGLFSCHCVFVILDLFTSFLMRVLSKCVILRWQAKANRTGRVHRVGLFSRHSCLSHSGLWTRQRGHSRQDFLTRSSPRVCDCRWLAEASRTGWVHTGVIFWRHSVFLILDLWPGKGTFPRGVFLRGVLPRCVIVRWLAETSHTGWVHTRVWYFRVTLSFSSWACDQAKGTFPRGDF